MSLKSRFCILAFGFIAGLLSCTNIGLAEQKPYLWSFSKASPESYTLRTGLRLPVIGAPAVGTNILLPTATNSDSWEPARSYVPRPLLWAALHFAKGTPIEGYGNADLNFRFDPMTQRGILDMTVAKVAHVTKRLILDMKDRYTLSVPGSRLKNTSWNTRKSIRLSLTRFGTSLTAFFNTSTNDQVWHANLAADQSLTKSIRFRATLSDLQSKQTNSNFQLRFFRRW